MLRSNTALSMFLRNSSAPLCFLSRASRSFQVRRRVGTWSMVIEVAERHPTRELVSVNYCTQTGTAICRGGGHC